MRTIFFFTIVLLLVQFPAKESRAWGGFLQEPSPPAQDLVVTSDSQAYCAQLSRSLAQKIRTPHSVPVGAMDDARHLQEKGEELCQQNHIRAGIGRLRRALVLLKHQEKLHQ